MEGRRNGSFGRRKTNVEDVEVADLDLPWHFYLVMMAAPSVLIGWLMANGLLISELHCPTCNSPCTVQKCDSIDGCKWRCDANGRHTKSIRLYSIFSHSKLHIQDILQFMHGFCQGLPLYKLAKNSGMNYKNTAVHWASYVREVMMQWVYDNLRNMKLQGEVEIDESLFGRRCKYHRGARRGQKIWILGMVERSTNRLLLFPVENRNGVTLIGLIKEHVQEGSTIYTDSWMGYSKLNEEGFRHFSVCHKHTFRQKYVNTVTGEFTTVNTNQIEGAWANAKQHFRKINGTSVSNFEGHLCEILFRNHCRTKNVLASLIAEIRKVYTLQAPPNYNYERPVFTSWRPDLRDSIIGSDGSDVNEEEDTNGESEEVEVHDEKGNESTPSTSVSPQADDTEDSPQRNINDDNVTVRRRRREPIPPTSPSHAPREQERRKKCVRRKSSPKPGPSREEENTDSDITVPPRQRIVSPRAGPSRQQKRRGPPHFCPKDYRIVDDSEWEEETVNASQSGPQKTSTRGRVIRPKKRKSFVEIPDEDSDFM